MVAAEYEPSIEATLDGGTSNSRAGAINGLITQALGFCGATALMDMITFLAQRPVPYATLRMDHQPIPGNLGESAPHTDGACGARVTATALACFRLFPKCLQSACRAPYG
jgi:hypothetical protein